MQVVDGVEVVDTETPINQKEIAQEVKYENLF